MQRRARLTVAAAHARAAATATLGSILALRGDAQRARALLLEGLSIARRIELTAAEILAGWGLALLDHGQDECRWAADRCDAILERWQQTEERHYTIAPLRWATTLLAESGDGTGARACAGGPRADRRRPFDWGDEARVRELLGDTFDLRLERHDSPVRLPSGEAYWQLFSTSYGPAKTLADGLGERREQLHWAWVDFFESNHRTNGEIAHSREYLLVTGERC